LLVDAEAELPGGIAVDLAGLGQARGDVSAAEVGGLGPGDPDAVFIGDRFVNRESRSASFDLAPPIDTIDAVAPIGAVHAVSTTGAVDSVAPVRTVYAVTPVRSVATVCSGASGERKNHQAASELVHADVLPSSSVQVNVRYSHSEEQVAQ
jgi:hypothetical protein